MKKLLIFDDDDQFRRNHLERLEKSSFVTKYFKPKEVSSDEFSEILTILEARRLESRKDSVKAFKDKCILDDCDVFIVDYDLLMLKSGGFLTGENVSYLARCFSTCGFIIALNQFGDNFFDLTLKGFPSSFADLNIGSEQLHSSGLWSTNWKGFRPWSWPIIQEAVNSYERRTKELAKAMDKPILSYLQFPEKIVRLLPRSSTEFIGAARKITETTFEQFVSESGNGLRGGAEKTSEECSVRIAAARISKWLEYMILAGQDILVDAPHLVSRYPSLLTSTSKNASTLNATACLENENGLGIDHKKIVSHRFAKNDWLSRPAWYWPDLAALDAIQEVRNPWETKHIDLVFCEDTSRFADRKKCHEFVADLPSQFARRFIAKVGNVNYRPEVRLSL